MTAPARSRDQLRLDYARVLVPLDGSDLAARGAQVGAHLASALGVPLALLAVVPDAPEIPPVRDRLRAQIDAGVLPDGELTVRAGLMPAATIIEAAAPDTLVVMASHGRGRLTGAVLGSVAEAVVREGRLPVVVAGPALDPSTLGPLSRLVACVDGSDLSEAILPVAAAWAGHLRLQLELVQVIREAAARQVQAAAPDVSEFAYVRGLARDLRQRWGVEPEWDVLHGHDVAGALASYIGAPGTLVALSTHGRSGAARLALGSVAARLVRLSRVPLLVARPADLDAPG